MSDRRSWNRALVAVAALSVVFASGCSVDQDAEVAFYRNVLDEHAPESVPPLQAGEALTLERALALANRHNEQLALRGEDYVQALIDKTRATAAFLPQVTLGGGLNFSQLQTASGGHQINHSASTSGNAAQNVFNGFRDQAGAIRADASAEQRRALLLDLQSSVLLSVAQTYYQVLRTERSVVVLQGSLALDAERIRDMAARRDAGIAKPLDVAQTEANQAATRVSILQAQSDVRNGRTTLAFLMGGGVVDGVLDDRFVPPTELRTLDEALANAAAMRQDMLASAHGLDASRQDVEIAIGSAYPSISADLNKVLVSDPTSIVGWSLGFSLNLPIFTGGIIEANIRSAWSRYRATTMAHRLLQRQVAQDVRIAQENLSTSRDKLRETAAEVDAARKALDLATRSYALGAASNLDRLIAQDRLLVAELSLTTESFNTKVFYLDLMRVTGRLDMRALPDLRGT